MALDWPARLPYELSEHILSFICGEPSICASILLVCRRWSDIMKTLVPKTSILVDIGTFHTKTIDFHYNRLLSVVALTLDTEIDSFRSVVGSPRIKNKWLSIPERLVGENAWSRRGILYMHRRDRRDKPLCDNEKMVYLLEDTSAGQLETNPLLARSSCDLIMLVDPSLEASDVQHWVKRIWAMQSRLQRIGTATPAPFVAAQARERTALVVDLGASEVSVDPVIDAHAHPGARRRLPWGLEAVLTRFSLHMTERGYMFTTSAEVDLLRDMLAQHGRVFAHAGAGTEDDDDCDESYYELPDGQVISFRTERMRCFEILFAPPNSDHSAPPASGLHDLIAESILECPPEAQEPLCAHILLCGGGSAVRNLPERLEADVRRLLPPRLAGRVRVTVAPSGPEAAIRGLQRCLQDPPAWLADHVCWHGHVRRE